MNTIIFQGQTYEVRIEQDHEIIPAEYDCYSAEDIERWERNKWYFVTVSVWTTGNNAECLGSLGAVEWDLTDSNEYALRTVPLELLKEWATRLNEKEEPVGRGELSWTQDAVNKLIELAHKRPLEDLQALVNTVQRLAQSDDEADEIEPYHVEDTFTGLWS